MKRVRVRCCPDCGEPVQEGTSCDCWDDVEIASDIEDELDECENGY